MEYLTVQEAARVLKVAPITIRRYIAQGRLHAVKVGKAVRVEKEAVEALPEPIEAPDGLAPRPHAKPVTADDPVFKLIGTARSKGPTDVSTNKLKYLAEAYADLHDSA